MSPNKFFSPERLNMSGLKVNLEECQCQKNATDATQATNAPTGSSDSNATTYNQGNGQEELIMMTGPLGEVYTKALAQYFVKSPDKSLEDISIESQAQDVALTTAALREHIRKVAEQGAGVRIVDQSANIVKTPRIIAYAVPANATTQPENIVKVQAWVDKAKRTNREVVMICDSTITNTNWMGTNANVVFDDKIPTPFDIGQNFVRATENYFEPMGVTVVNGARGFVDWVKENCGQGKYVPVDPLGDTSTQSVGLEGLLDNFLESVKNMFTTKKQIETAAKAKDTAVSDVALKKSQLEYEKDFGKVNKVLTELTKPSFVKDNCPNQKSDPGVKDLVNGLKAIRRTQQQLQTFIVEVEKAMQTNVTKANDGGDEAEMINLIPIMRKELNKLPTDFGFGIKFKVFDNKDYDKPVWLAEEFDEDAKFSEISKLKLSHSDVVTIAKLILDIQRNESNAATTIPMFFEETREGKELKTDLPSKYYYSDYELTEMVGRSSDDDSDDGVYIGIGDVAEGMLDNALRCLNNHLTDKSAKDDGDHEYR